MLDSLVRATCWIGKQVSTLALKYLCKSGKLSEAFAFVSGFRRFSHPPYTLYGKSYTIFGKTESFRAQLRKLEALA